MQESISLADDNTWGQQCESVKTRAVNRANLMLGPHKPATTPHLLALPPWHFGYTLHANLGHKSPAILGSPPQAIPTHTRPLLSSMDEHKRNPVRSVGKKLGSSSGTTGTFKDLYPRKPPPLKQPASLNVRSKKCERRLKGPLGW
ncbi:hypothetical protein BDQ17DRAFT_1335245 [Cyathus striatus]|nr:hypothetical protein BDQ17DRAFT_1335245 [Cyathus striatus]